MPLGSAVFRGLAEVVRELKPSRGRIVLTTALLLPTGALEGATIGMLVPLLTVLTGSQHEAQLPVVGRAFDFVAPHYRLAALALVVALLPMAKNALLVLFSHSASKLRSGMLIELQRQLLGRVLTASPATLEAHTSGEITDVFVAKAYRVNRFIDYSLSLVQRVIIAASYGVAILLLSWRLTLATMVIGACIAIFAGRLGRRVLAHGRELSRASSELGRQVTEIVGGLRVIRTTASERSFAGRFAEHSATFAGADSGSTVSLAVQQAGIESLGVVGAIALVILANRLLHTGGALDVPHFLAFGFALVRLLPALNVVYATHGLLTSMVGSIEDTLAWLHLPAYPERPFGTEKVRRLTRGIAFEGVTFRYPNGPEPLKNLSFSLPAGETLAVVGPSGAGKSTLASILLRLREPTSGRITFDGVDHWQFDREEFPRAVGFVDQESFLFNLSIAENVACGRSNVSREAIVAALRLVQLGDLVERLPNGIDTVLAERGATLSGGQRQRIAIARAIVSDPDVLVLDEPTSALDVETEREVMQAVAAASAGRTTLVITHRGAILRHATLRLDLATGKVSAVAPTGVSTEQATG